MSGSIPNAGNRTMNRSVMVSVLLGLTRKTQQCSVSYHEQSKCDAITRTRYAQRGTDGAHPDFENQGYFPRSCNFSAFLARTE